MNILQTTIKAAALAFAAAPIVCVAAPSAAESQVLKARTALVKKLTDAGVLRAEHSAALMAIPVEVKGGAQKIQLHSPGNKPVIVMPPNYLESLCKKMSSDKAMQVFIGELGAVLAQAELEMVCVGDTSAIPQELQQGLAEAMAVSAFNVISPDKTKLTLTYSSPAVNQYMTQGTGAACLRYDSAKGVYIPDYSALPTAADAQPAAPAASDNSYTEKGVMNILSGGMGGKPIASVNRSSRLHSAQKKKSAATKVATVADAAAPAPADEKDTPIYLNPVVLGGAGGGVLLLLIILVLVARKKK